MCASSRLSRHGSPAPPRAKLITLTTIGRTRPSSFCWSRSALIQAPLCLEFAGEIVADEQRDRRAVGAERRPGARVRVRQSHVVAGDEGDAEQAMGDVEGGGDHPFQRQIGPDLALVDVVERLAALLGVVAPVPRLELEIAALGGDQSPAAPPLRAAPGRAPAPTRAASDRAPLAASWPSSRRGGRRRSSESRAAARARRATRRSRA